jgi:FAD/FMN-containing dehydrogenase
MTETALESETVSALRAIVGDAGVLTGDDTASYCEDWRKLYRNAVVAVVRPASTREVADVVRICAMRHIGVVPQGGNTGMVGGGVPIAHRPQIVLSLARMSRIRAIDPIDQTMVVEAGMTLQAARDGANDAGCLFPLSIASEGTAQIGGILATNAGGINTVRYGNARDLVLGLEVVLADGQVWNGLRRLRKDNTGYCLRQLFVGSEGTLGVITAATLKLYPRQDLVETVFCAVPSPEAALALFSRVQRSDPATLQSFEIISGRTLELVLKHIPGVVRPLKDKAAYYVLIECAAPQGNNNLRQRLETALHAAMTDGVVGDVVIAETQTQRRALWKLREDVTEAQAMEGASFKNDVSVPVSRTAEFIHKASAACEAAMPGVTVIAFGHMGDGNIHYNLMKPRDMSAAEFGLRGPAFTDIVNEVIRELDGSFSAEHGIGQLKTSMLAAWRAGIEIDVMQRIKTALDPQSLLNPGKVFPAN